MIESLYFFSVYDQKLYLRCLLLNLSLLQRHKEKNSPIWNLFMKCPECFNEVKGEWSLAQITTHLLSKRIHSNIDKASECYSLLSSIKELDDDVENGFFGYSGRTKNWTEDDNEIILLRKLFRSHIKSIINEESFIYPKINGYHYPKYNTIDLLTIDELEEDSTLLEIFSFDEDTMEEEINYTKNLKHTNCSVLYTAKEAR